MRTKETLTAPNTDGARYALSCLSLFVVALIALDFWDDSPTYSFVHSGKTKLPPVVHYVFFKVGWFVSLGCCAMLFSLLFCGVVG